MIVTEKAINEVKRIIQNEGLEQDKVALRAKIVGAGCSGFSAKLDLDENFDETKDEITFVDGIRVVVDKRSALYLDDTTKIDYLDGDLNKTGFFVDLPAAKSRCGCGNSFSM